MNVLYSDTMPLLEKGVQDAQRLCGVFNSQIAPAYAVEPITDEEIEEYLQAAANREADAITALARAKAELAFGNRFSACPLIAETIRLAETPDNLRRSLGASIPYRMD